MTGDVFLLKKHGEKTIVSLNFPKITSISKTTTTVSIVMFIISLGHSIMYKRRKGRGVVTYKVSRKCIRHLLYETVRNSKFFSFAPISQENLECQSCLCTCPSFRTGISLTSSSLFSFLNSSYTRVHQDWWIL